MTDHSNESNEDDVLIVRKELEEALKQRDWYYNCSGDNSLWYRCRSNYVRVLSLMNRYAKMMGQEAADEIWNANCPNNLKINIRKKE
jgi:hypothetical protein